MADRVRRWNEIYFEKLGKDINSIYVAHQNVFGRGMLDAFKEYAKQYPYVAVNESFKSEVTSIYQTAKQTKTCIHGLAWTKPTILDDNPFFSVDSSSWVNYQKFGATPIFDGTNFKQYDNNNKAIRSTQKHKCIQYGVKYYEFCNEVDEGTDKHNDDEGLTFSLRTWLDVFQHIKKFARTKLNYTLADMLEGKKTIFVEDNSTPTPTTPQAPANGGGLLGALAVHGVNSAPTVPTTFSVDGNVAMYEKRETGKVAVADFIKQTGDVLICNYCHISDKCPMFKEDNTCAFDFSSLESTKTPLDTIDFLIQTQTERVNRAMLIEKMEGGNINKVYSQELRVLEQLNTSRTNLLIMMQNKGLNVSKVIVEHTNAGEKTEDKSEEGGFRSMLLDMMGNK